MSSITKECVRDGCSEIFSGTKSEIGRKRYCSRSCAAKVNNATAKKRSVEGSCKKCNKPISTRYVYCSDECRGWEFSLGRTGPVQRTYAYNPNCEICGGIKIGSRDRRYCSDECRKVATVIAKEKFRELKAESWLAGEIGANGKYALLEWARGYILDRAGLVCEAIDDRTGERCTEDRINPRTGKTVLQVDHIDGNWENCSPDNLRAICPTCHALTPTWGAGNMGKGRTWKSGYNQYGRKR